MVQRSLCSHVPYSFGVWRTGECGGGPAAGLALYQDYGTDTRLLMEPWPPGAAGLSLGPSEAVPAPRNSSVTLNHCAEIQWLASLS